MDLQRHSFDSEIVFELAERAPLDSHKSVGLDLRPPFPLHQTDSGVFPSLGTRAPVLSQYMLGTWWFHVPNTDNLLNQYMLGMFQIY